MGVTAPWAEMKKSSSPGNVPGLTGKFVLFRTSFWLTSFSFSQKQLTPPPDQQRPESAGESFQGINKS
jgi:hypothetical protein